MSELENTIRERLRRELAPLPTEPPALGRIKLLASSPRRPRWRPRWPMVLRLAAAASVVTVVVSGPFVLSRGEDRDEPQTASLTLSTIAAAAQRQSAPAAAPGTFLYRRLVYRYREMDVSEAVYKANPVCTGVGESWESPDGRAAGRTVSAVGVRTSLTDRTSDPTRLPAARGCNRDVNYGSDAADPARAAQYAQNPPDPRAYYEQILQVHLAAKHADPQARTFEDLLDVLRLDHPSRPPYVRATTLRALALVPGMQQGGVVTDQLGRRGLLIIGPAWSYDRAPDTVTVSVDGGEFLASTRDGLPSLQTTAVVRGVKERPTS